MQPSLIISIYAAIVSTLVFFWRVFEFFYDRYPRIKVEVGELIEGTNHFCIIQITNRSKQKRYIEAPLFIADKVFKETSTMFGSGEDLNLPLPLEMGEKIEIKFPYAILKRYEKNYQIKRIKAIIKDTLGNKYKSQWTDI